LRAPPALHIIVLICIIIRYPEKPVILGGKFSKKRMKCRFNLGKAVKIQTFFSFKFRIYSMSKGQNMEIQGAALVLDMKR
jgi:hypothetical protein